MKMIFPLSSHKSKIPIIVLIVLLTLVLLSVSNGEARQITKQTIVLPQTTFEEYAPDRMIVRIKDIDRLNVTTTVVSSVIFTKPLFPNTLAQLSDIFVFQLAPGSDVLSLAKNLSSDPNVVWAEPDYLAKPAGNIQVTPNDPYFPSQWGLTKINSPAAWDVNTGNNSVIIAILDSGIQLDHPELINRLWINPGEIPENGVDDDNNGFVDDVDGWNFVNNDNNPSDDNGHGTQVAGVAVAETNNNLGVAGTCWGCLLMPVKVMSAGGVANYSDIAAAIQYAAAKGADVINISLGGYNYSHALEEAVQTAKNNYGAMVIAGAGNDNSSSIFYPAAYTESLAVAGTDQNDLKSYFSNYGAWVDLSAPAVDITTTYMGGNYGSVEFTSFSSAFVSGVAGLVLSEHPDWSQAMVFSQLTHTTDPLDTLNPNYASMLGAGRLNAGAALTIEPNPLITIATRKVNGDQLGRPFPGESATLEITLSNGWLDATGVVGSLSSSDSYVTVTQGEANFGDISSGGNGTSNPLYAFEVALGAGYDHSIPFTLDITGNGGGYFTSFDFTINTRSAEQPVQGSIFTDSTWTSDKTYVVMNNINVAPGVTLTIQAGTTIEFNGNYSLNIGGQLLADGTQDQPILFTEHNGLSWGRIYFDDTSIDAIVNISGTYQSGNILRWADVRGATQGIGCYFATPYLSHLTTDQGGIQCNTGDTSLWLQDSDLTGSANFYTAPTVSIYETPGEARGIAVLGRYAYVADGLFGLRVIDVGDAANPVEVGFYDTPGQALGVAVEGGYAYVTDYYSGLRVVDVGDPDNPVEVGNSDTLGAAQSVAVSGGYAYVTDFSAGLRVVDVSDPANPAEVGFYGMPFAYGIVISDTYAYVANSDSGLRVVDISDPTHPIEVGAYDTPGAALGVAVSGGYAYVADDTRGLRVVDVSDPSNPIETDWIGTPGNANSVVVSAGYAYVGDGLGELSVVDVSNPQKLIKIASYGYSCSNLTVANGYVYEVNRSSHRLIISHTFGSMRNVAVMNTNLSLGSLNLPMSSTVQNSTVNGDLIMGSGSVVSDSTTGGGITISGRGSILDSSSGGPVIVNSGTVKNVIVMHSGIYISSGEVFSNTISSGGISVGDSSLVRGNNIENNPYWGIQSTGIVTITQNRLVGNSDGIRTGGGIVQANLVADSTGVGIEVNGNTTIISNTLIDNFGSTILLNSGTNIKIEGNNLEYNNGIYDIENLTAAEIRAQNNWWGTTDSIVISGRIYDYYDDYKVGRVVFQPFNDNSVRNAPAYVRNVTVTPNPVGIDRATFDVQFSREMDTDNFPEIYYWDIEHNGDIFDVINNPLWLDSSNFRASYDITSLITRTHYTIHVGNSSGLDGIEIAPNESYTFTVDYAGSIGDTTPPSKPRITACAGFNPGTLTASWQSYDPDSQITLYEYAVSTSKGGIDIINWTTTVVQNFTRTGLVLKPGQTYYVSVQARNEGGLWSQAGTTGITSGSGICTSNTSGFYFPLIFRK